MSAQPESAALIRCDPQPPTSAMQDIRVASPAHNYGIMTIKRANPPDKTSEKIADISVEKFFVFKNLF